MRELNDEDFIHVARYFRYDTNTVEDRKYVEQRLQYLGYTLEYGCCGRNILRMIQNERQSHL